MTPACVTVQPFIPPDSRGKPRSLVNALAGGWTAVACRVARGLARRHSRQFYLHTFRKCFGLWYLSGNGGVSFSVPSIPARRSRFARVGGVVDIGGICFAGFGWRLVRGASAPIGLSGRCTIQVVIYQRPVAAFSH